MQDFFHEKAQEVEPSSLTAFGIGISSRYGKERELIEMIKFAGQAAAEGVNDYVTKVYYDSQSRCCFISLAPSIQEEDPVAERLRIAALRTISQFQRFGSVLQGGNGRGVAAKAGD